jgi:hypothetical protein
VLASKDLLHNFDRGTHDVCVMTLVQTGCRPVKNAESGSLVTGKPESFSDLRS